jgi:hypothetical protein
MGWVTGAVGDEDTIVVLSNLVDGVVVRENSDRGSSANQAAKNVLLHTAVNEGNVVLGTGGLDNEGSLGADTLDQVNLTRVDVAFVLVGIILLANGDTGKGRTLLSKEGDDLSGINARDGRHTLSGAPLAEGLDSGPVAVVEGNVGDDNTSALDMGGLEVLEEVELVSLVGRDSVVANQGLSEDENLASVRGVGHGLGVTDERGGENGFTRDVGIGAKGLASEERTISNSQSSRDRRSWSSGRSSFEGHLPALAARSKGLPGQVSDLEESARSRRGLGRGVGKLLGQLGEHG